MTLIDPQSTGSETRSSGVNPARPSKSPSRFEGTNPARAVTHAPFGSAADGGFWERAVRGRLARLEAGSMTLRTGSGTTVFGEAPPSDLIPSPHMAHAHASVDVHDARFWQALALRGSVGAGEAYAQGWWTSPEITDVIRVFVANQKALDGMEGGLALISRPFLKAFHALRDNTRNGAKKNIAAHYDLSNDFFGLFLDPTMTYSSAVFESPDMDLESAQIAKIDRLCDRLQLVETDHLLEIGTGWGGFAIRAASRFGCRVTTTTISKEQHAIAVERVRAAGLEDRVDVLLRDYRDLEGSFDKIVSVEMIEAVGARHYAAYMGQVERLLAPGGAFAMQAITIHDRHFDRARRAVDFIQRHIFPGSCIPSVTALTEAARDNSDMRLVHLEDIGEHYVPTLRTWRDTLRGRWNEAQALGFDEDFLRLFDFYFAYCEGGFAERHISVAHLVFAREGRRFTPPIARSISGRG